VLNPTYSTAVLKMRLAWLTLFWVSLSSAQYPFIPENNCDGFFQYAPAAFDGHYMGIFTAPFISNLSFHWKATFIIKGHRGVRSFFVQFVLK